MKLAVLGDVHANLPALEAVLDAARREKVERIVHTGDVVGLGPFPQQTIRMLAQLGIDGVRGNFDEAAAYDYETLPGASGARDWSVEAAASLRWTQSIIDYPAKTYLRDLPFELRLRAAGRTLAIYHANPLDYLTPVLASTPEHALREFLDEAAADVLIVGHTHRELHRPINGSHVLNAGSVGLQEDGDPRARLLVLDVGLRVNARWIKVPYEVERTVNALEAAGLPVGLARGFRSGTQAERVA